MENIYGCNDVVDDKSTNQLKAKFQVAKKSTFFVQVLITNYSSKDFA
jgi:hypothetical protein